MNLLTRLKKSDIKLNNAQAIKQFLIGKKVEILGADAAPGTSGLNSHGLSKGKTWTISNNCTFNINTNLEAIYLVDSASGTSSGIYLCNIKFVGGGSITVNDFNAEIELLEEEEKRIKADKQKAKDIIKFMQENEIGEFDEKVYNIYKVIKKLKSGTSDIEKAIEVAKLID